jgi:glycosyltransferase involved in cell wall biosynthesis
MYSLVIPVYRNEESISELLEELGKVNEQLEHQLEVVFVIDGSPDRCADLLRDLLPKCAFASRLLLLSRNFGSFPAIRAGLAEATGPYFAVMAADLQEPPELVVKFFHALQSESIDVVVGKRLGRDDSRFTRWTSQLFWSVYGRLVQSEMPPGGVDVFGCNLVFRNHLLSLNELNTSLVGLVLWLGFRRKLIGYRRQPRRHGKSAWTFSRRLRYLVDGVYAFSDLPIRILVMVGALGLVFSAIFSVVVVAARLTGIIEVPGYSATVLTITFLAGLNSFGLGVIGLYVWRIFENTKARPQVVVMSKTSFDGERG